MYECMCLYLTVLPPLTLFGIYLSSTRVRTIELQKLRLFKRLLLFPSLATEIVILQYNIHLHDSGDLDKSATSQKLIAKIYKCRLTFMLI